MMDIDGIGEETVELLYDAGLVRVPADLYDLTAEQLMKLEHTGRRSAERIIDGIRATVDVPFERVLYALSIPFCGETVSKRLAKSVKSIDALMSLSAEQLTEIEDVGPRIANSIIDYFSQPDNRDNVERLRKAGLQMSVTEQEGLSSGDQLTGKTVVISGTFTRHSRDEYKDMIERHGGKNAGSVSKKTSFILAGDNMGPAKLEKARSLGVPVINEDEFLNMIADGQ